VVILSDAPSQKLNISGYLALDSEGKLWTISSGEIYRITLIGE
jgi:DNA-binding PadR family transcriptional regulator